MAVERVDFYSNDEYEYALQAEEEALREHEARERERYEEAAPSGAEGEKHE